MTRVGQGGHEMSPQASLDEAARRGREDRETGTSRGGLGSRAGEMKEGESRFDQPPGGDYAESRERFLDHVRKAIEANSETPRAAADDERQPRLIAEAGLPAQPPASPFAPDATPVAPPQGIDAGTQARVERAEAVAARIDSAISAEMAATARSQGIALRLPLGADAIPGVGALTVTMSATSIDVVLERTGAELPADFAASAQALADRLQARFARRSVRILDIEAEPERREANGLDAISSLLGRRGGAT